MRLTRFGTPGAEKPAILDSDGRRRDLTGIVSDVTGAALSPGSLRRLAEVDPAGLPAVPESERWAPCVGGIGKMICIGLNYADHAEESGMEVPPEPVVFFKATSAICGPYDEVEIPRGSTKTDWEVELGVVIGTRAKYVTPEAAMDHVAGYCIVNDVSERDFQLQRAGQWVKGKSHDTFGPLGPWLLTADQVTDPQDLAMSLSVDGHRYQNGSTRTMVYRVDHLISYLSGFMTLEPGDVISTGTPPGVGAGQKPPVFLRPGQVMELSVEGLGTQRQKTVAA
ncbi:fumarylacetoacetate hydrolase family protein [Algihabitans albus]|uniref:fumarylacetoacetate hydrolase family protein n=1 Tax=Algihabitans albus TaxID=2164067 RepID=UPI000E5D1AAD|nr:fumarylacetoacetate hydrolase family protein [Algihabitans albus]